MLDQITPLILTYNEAPNIDRTLKKLVWADRIVVIDSYSTDETLSILSRYSQVVCYQRTFDTHTSQWNYGLEQIKTTWVLSLDADYTLSDALIEELENLSPAENIHGYCASFKYFVFGKPLKATILPPRQILSRKNTSIYVDDGHTQLLKLLEGQSAILKNPVHHDDRKPLPRWLWAQGRYMEIEAKKLIETPHTQLSWSDRLRRKKLLAPFVILLYCLVLRGGIFDGWRGIYYAFQRMLAETLLSIKIIELEAVKGRGNRE